MQVLFRMRHQHAMIIKLSDSHHPERGPDRHQRIHLTRKKEYASKLMHHDQKDATMHAHEPRS